MAEKMQIKQHEPEIETNNIWKDDQLEVKKFAARLTSLLQGQTEPLTVALNGAWGSGKTFLLKRWCEDLKKQGHTAIYFNAWEDDHLDDPLVAIIGQLWLELKGGMFKEACKKVKNASIPLLITETVASTIKHYVQEKTGIVLPDDLKKKMKTGTKTAYDDYLSRTKSQKDLRNRLQELANKVYNKQIVCSSDGEPQTGREHDGFVKNSFPLIFIVDELDRCRPTFAISVLERIKHLFNIQHIVFVLGIDRGQLGKSIQSVYGEIDVDNYLHRFIDLEFRLQVAKQELFIDALWEKYQIERFLSVKTEEEKHAIKKNEGGLFKQMFNAVSQYHHFSLREIEQCIKVFVMIQNTIPERHFIWPEMLVLLLVIKMRFRNLYWGFVEGTVPPNVISDNVFPQDVDRNSQEFFYMGYALYASYLSNYPTKEIEKEIHNLLEDAKTGNVQSSTYASNRLKMFSKQALQDFSKMVTDYSKRTYSEQSWYDNKTIRNLHNMIDEISLQ